MQYAKCMKCIHDGKLCKFIIVETLLTSLSLEELTNRSLRYMKFKPDNKITVSIDFKCNGFIPKEDESEV